ncbi:HipA domain-containing protein [Brachybacterium sp. J144]|uniref:HipA domain-containing protein n=1 Tax=Brachybacterium sp. J144 TaxID=3116487 RepID=UPI002E78A5A6|nr:HipA domain-containing protein [Brachybacterium sp. J144]MEE1650585.1 HipA domain-containing protein [Brachybacterium sp. J144]
MSAEIRDVTGWAVSGDEWIGDQKKEWLLEPASDGGIPPRRWLFKPSRRVARLGKQGQDAGTITWFDAQSEFVACRVAKLIGVPVAEVDLANRADSFGCVSRNIASQEEDLQSGDVFLAGVAGPSYIPNAARTRNRTGHRLDTIGLVLDGIDPPNRSMDGDARTAFAGFLVLDAWIGNTDRHSENWALLVGPEGSRLAPSFDHGSSLAAGRDDAFLQRKDPREFARGAMAKKFDGGKTVPLVDLAKDALCRWGGPWISRLRDVDTAQVAVIVDSAPGLSDHRRTFVLRMLEENRRRLIDP